MLPDVKTDLRSAALPIRDRSEPIEAALRASPYLAFLLLGILFFPSTGHDDAYITYWAAHALASLGEIVNYSGERVEQSSSLLHTLAIAGLAKLSGAEPPVVGRLIGILGGLLTVFLAGRLARTIAAPVLACQLFAATAVPVLYWSFGGLETAPVAAALLAILLACDSAARRGPGVGDLRLLAAIAVYVALRPEAVFVLVLFFALLGLYAWHRREAMRIPVFGLAGALAVFALLTLWRLRYFGDAFPQPVSAKVGSDTLNDIGQGLEYLRVFVDEYPAAWIFPVAVIGCAAKILWGKAVRGEVYSLAILAAYVAFVVATGGDWMEGGRFLAPVVPVAGLLAVNLFVRGGLALPAVALLAALQGLSLHRCIDRCSTAIPVFQAAEYRRLLDTRGFSFFDASNRDHFRDIPLIRELKPWMQRVAAMEGEAVLLSRQAGMVPYHAIKDLDGRARFVDAHALASREMSECRPVRGWGSDRYGIRWSYETYVREREVLEHLCDLPRPHLIFDLDSSGRLGEWLAELGYTVVYRQDGYVNLRARPRGGEAKADQLIGVRSDLLGEFATEAKVFHFPGAPF